MKTLKKLFFLIFFICSTNAVKAQQNKLTDKIWEVSKHESVIDYNHSIYNTIQSGKKAFIIDDFQNETSTITVYDSLGGVISRVAKNLDWAIPYKIHLTDSSIVIWNEQYKNIEKYESKFVLTDSLSINYDCTHLANLQLQYGYQQAGVYNR